MKLETSQFDLTATGFSLPNARLCLQAAADAYVESNQLSVPNGSNQSGPATGPLITDLLITSATTDTHVLIRKLGPALLIAFRGSASLRNWVTDFDAHKQAIAHSHIHEGFYRAALSVRDELRDAIAKSACRVVFITGHSLGGALAVIASWMLHQSSPSSSACRAVLSAEASAKAEASSEGGSPPNASCPTPHIHSTYTFGQPRVGDAAFARSQLSTLNHQLFRITNRADLVPWVPGYLMGYRHFGNHIHCDALGIHENFPFTAELLGNGLEIYREFRRGQCALLADHAVAEYQTALQ